MKVQSLKKASVLCQWY